VDLREVATIVADFKGRGTESSERMLVHRHRCHLTHVGCVPSDTSLFANAVFDVPRGSLTCLTTLLNFD
jgi:hypothetical protein